MEEIKMQFDQSAKGSIPENKAEIPQFLTAEKTLQILKKMFQETSKRIQSAFRELKQRDAEINMNDPRVLQALAATKLEEAKENILKESGLDDFQDSSQKILQAAVQKYSRDMRFSEQMMELEMKQQKSIEMSMINPDQDLDAFYNEPMQVAQPPMFPGLHSQRRKQQQPSRANPPSLKPEATPAEITPQVESQVKQSLEKQNSELFQTANETQVTSKEEEQKCLEVSEKSAVNEKQDSQEPQIINSSERLPAYNSSERLPVEEEKSEKKCERPSTPQVNEQKDDGAIDNQMCSAERIPEPSSDDVAPQE